MKASNKFLKPDMVHNGRYTGNTDDEYKDIYELDEEFRAYINDNPDFEEDFEEYEDNLNAEYQYGGMFTPRGTSGSTFTNRSSRGAPTSRTIAPSGIDTPSGSTFKSRSSMGASTSRTVASSGINKTVPFGQGMLKPANARIILDTPERDATLKESREQANLRSKHGTDVLERRPNSSISLNTRITPINTGADVTFNTIDKPSTRIELPLSGPDYPFTDSIPAEPGQSGSKSLYDISPVLGERHKQLKSQVINPAFDNDLRVIARYRNAGKPRELFNRPRSQNNRDKSNTAAVLPQSTPHENNINPHTGHRDDESHAERDDESEAEGDELNINSVYPEDYANTDNNPTWFTNPINPIHPEHPISREPVGDTNTKFNKTVITTPKTNIHTLNNVFNDTPKVRRLMQNAEDEIRKEEDEEFRENVRVIRSDRAKRHQEELALGLKGADNIDKNPQLKRTTRTEPPDDSEDDVPNRRTNYTLKNGRTNARFVGARRIDPNLQEAEREKYKLENDRKNYEKSTTSRDMDRTRSENIRLEESLDTCRRELNAAIANGRRLARDRDVENDRANALQEQLAARDAELAAANAREQALRDELDGVGGGGGGMRTQVGNLTNELAAARGDAKRLQKELSTSETLVTDLTAKLSATASGSCSNPQTAGSSKSTNPIVNDWNTMIYDVTQSIVPTTTSDNSKNQNILKETYPSIFTTPNASETIPMNTDYNLVIKPTSGNDGIHIDLMSTDPTKTSSYGSITIEPCNLSNDTVWGSRIIGYMPDTDASNNFIIDPTADILGDYCWNSALCSIYKKLNITKFVIMTDKMYKVKANNVIYDNVSSFKYGMISKSGGDYMPVNFYRTLYGRRATYINKLGVQAIQAQQNPTQQTNVIPQYELYSYDINNSDYKSYINAPIGTNFTPEEINKYDNNVNTALKTLGVNTNELYQAILIDLN